MKVLVLHGPNLNLLGERDPGLYGCDTLESIDDRLTASGEAVGVSVECRQSNSEGELVFWTQEAAFGPPERRFSGVLLNPGGYAHTSVALLDAISATVAGGVPVIEVHLSNTHAREPFRRRMLTARAASGTVTGLGPLSYDVGLEAIIRLAKR